MDKNYELEKLLGVNPNALNHEQSEPDELDLQNIANDHTPIELQDGDELLTPWGNADEEDEEEEYKPEFGKSYDGDDEIYDERTLLKMKVIEGINTGESEKYQELLDALDDNYLQPWDKAQILFHTLKWTGIYYAFGIFILILITIAIMATKKDEE